ncbi:MAG: metallophosphoesterase [Acidimicrobiia bacterium]
MSTVRIAQLSDTHLSHRRAYAVPNVLAVLQAITDEAPDFVIHTGDVAADDPDDEDERAFAFRVLSTGMPQPFAVIPGNHDTGGFSHDLWSEARNAAFLETWRADTFCRDLGAWRLIGANVYRLGEAAHDEWLTAMCTTERFVALFLHQPIFLRDVDIADEGDWSIGMDQRGALQRSLGTADVRLVASGHLHRYRAPTPMHVLAPSAGFLGSPTDDGSRHVIGYVSYDLHEDGSFEHRLVVPPGVEQLSFAEFAPPHASSMRDAPLLPLADMLRPAR